MTGIHLITIESARDLRRAAPRWDALWGRSGISVPTLRAEPLAQWIDYFAPRHRFMALVAAQAGRFLGALPLIERKLGRVYRCAGLPTNEWAHSGDLLLDWTADAEVALNTLVRAFDCVPWRLFCFDTVSLDARRWRLLYGAVHNRGGAIHMAKRFDVGLANLGDGWPTYRQNVTRNHRRQMERSVRRLRSSGDVRLQVSSGTGTHAVESAVREAFAIENRGWKGARGTSVVKTPGMLDFYLGQAREMARRGHLHIATLHHNARPIAFEYGWVAKRVYHSYKIGFDPEFARYGPGNVLLYMLLQHLCGRCGVVAVNGMGPIDPAMSRWHTSSFPVGRLAIAPSRPPSRLLLQLFHGAVATKQFWSDWCNAKGTPKGH